MLRKSVGCSTAAWSDSATVNKPRACRAFLSSHISPHTAAHSLAMYSVSAYEESHESLTLLREELLIHISRDSKRPLQCDSQVAILKTIRHQWVNMNM